MSSGVFKVFKKPSLIVLFLLAFGLLMTYQNCAQVQEGGLFRQSCNDESCAANPDQLSIAMDLNLVPGGIFKISSNPESGFENLRLTGNCKDGGYEKTLVKIKIYQCVGSSSVCDTLKYINTTSCNMNTNFEISETVSTLVPGFHKLNLEIVGLDEFGQEVYGKNSKLAPIKMQAQNTIRPPVLASFTGTNFWAQDKIYYFPTDSDKVTLDGYIQGFCDYNSAADDISAKLSFKGSSTYTAIALPTKCKPVAQNSAALNSPNRGARTGFFQIDAFPIYMRYTGGQFVTCTAGDYNCINNPLNLMTNRLVALAFFQRDVTFNYDVFSVRKLLLHFKDERSGKGWLAEPLLEVLRRVKKSFNFSNDIATGALDGTNAGNNDYYQAFRILTSADEFYDPLVTNGESRYGFGTRAFIVKWLLGATEDISPSIYPGSSNNYAGTSGNIYFLGGATTIPYKSVGNGTLCGLNPGITDPLVGTVGYDTSSAIERIALCLTHRFLNGLYDRDYNLSYRMVQKGVTFANNNTTCVYSDDLSVAIPARDCAVIMHFLAGATKMKTRHVLGASISDATDTQIKYFGNGLSQFYINTIVHHLAYRNTVDYVNENEVMSLVYATVYPELTDTTMRQISYPTEFNFEGATTMFSGTRLIGLPAGSFTYPSGN